MKSIVALFVELRLSAIKSLSKLFDIVNLYHRRIGLTLSVVIVASSAFVGYFRGSNIRQWVHQKHKERVVLGAASDFLNCMSEDPYMVIVGYQAFPSDGIGLIITFITPKWPDGMTLDEYRVYFFDKFTASNNKLFTCLNEYSWQGVSITYVDIVVVQTIDDGKIHATSKFRVQIMMRGDVLKTIIPSSEHSAPEQIDAFINSGDIDIISETLFPITVPVEMFNGDVERAIKIYEENN